MLQKIRAFARFSFEVVKEIPSFLLSTFVGIPLIHVGGFTESPRDVLGVFIVGPLAGLTSFLLNPKSLAISALAGAALFYGFPAVSLGLSLTTVLGLNLLTGLTESLIVRTSNRIELATALNAERGSEYEAYGVYYARKGIVEQKFPNANAAPTGLGPLAKAVYYNFKAANQTSCFRKPYHTFSDTHHIPEAIGGLKRST